MGPASASEVVGTLPPSANPVSPWAPPDGGLNPSTEKGSGDGGLANDQPWVGWRGSGDKVGFEKQGGGAGRQKEGS